MGTGKTYSTKYLLDSNNSSGVAGQVLSTTSTGIDWVDANTVPGTGLWLASGNNIYNSNSGNVGIGTASPAAALDVQGTSALFIARTSSGLATYIENDGGWPFLAMYQIAGGAKVKLDTNGNSYFNGGNVGIGETTPVSKLQVGTVMTNNTLTIGGYYGLGGGSLAFRSGHTNPAYIWNTAEIKATDDGNFNGRIEFKTSTSSRNAPDIKMVLKANGNVGIGTTSPLSKLHVSLPNQTLGFDSSIFLSANPSDYTVGRGAGITFKNADVYTGGVYGIREANNWTGALAFYTHTSSANNTFGSTFTEKMRISSAGNVGIGTITPDSKLDVTGGDITVNTSGVGFMNFKYGSAGSEVSRGTITTDGIDLKINSVADLLLLPSGANKVGVGTTNPSYKFHVSGASIVQAIQSSAADVSMVFINTTSTNYIEFFNGEYNLYQAGGSASNVTLKITNAGAVRFPKYSGTLQTGTPTYLLGTDASGNIVKTLPQGSGTAGPYLPLAGGTMTGTSGIEFPENFKLKWKNSSTSTEVFNIYSAGGTNFINSGDGTNSVKTKIVVGDGGLDINSNDPNQGIANFSIGGMGVSGTSHSFTSGSGANGDCVVVIAADTDNTVENSNPILQLKQDGGSLGASFGLNGNANDSFTGAIANGGYVKTAGAFQIAPGNLLTTTFLNGGNVGIGTNNPLHALEVYGDAKNIAITNTAETDAGIIFRDAQATTDQAAAIKFNSSDQKLKFFVNDEVAQRMVIDTSGNVGIGTSTPDYKLEVDGTMFSSGNFGNRNSAQTIGVQFEPGSTTATTMAVYSDELKIYYKGPNTTRFIFDEDGDAFKPGGGSWSSTSDERVKKDITNYTKGLTEILAIQPVNYKYNGKAGLPKEKQQVGVIAQDVQAVFPNAVVTYKALFNEDDIEETELLAFNPSELTFTLINAVKELKAEIELLKQQINN